MLYIKLDSTNNKEGNKIQVSKLNLIEQLAVAHSTMYYHQIRGAVGHGNVMHSCQIKIPSFSVKISPMGRMQLRAADMWTIWGRGDCRIVQEYKAHLVT